MNPNILITGGMGMMGRALTAELRREGRRVVVSGLGHDSSGPSKTDGPGGRPRYARADVGEFRQLEELFQRHGPFDFVFHCAAESRRACQGDFYESIWRTNVIGTRNILRLQERLRFRLVFFSAAMAESALPEKRLPFGAPPAVNDFTMTKWVSEIQIRSSARRHGTETVIVRLFDAYGPGERYGPDASEICRYVYRALHGRPWRLPIGRRRSFTYIDDAARAVAALVRHFEPGKRYTIGGRQAYSLEEVSAAVLRATGADPSLVRRQQFHGARESRRRVDATAAERELGLRFTVSLEEGVRRTASWMRDAYRASVPQSARKAEVLPPSAGFPAESLFDERQAQGLGPSV